MNGGDKGSRTPDLLNAIETLYQLSYIPKRCVKTVHIISYIPSLVNTEFYFIFTSANAEGSLKLERLQSQKDIPRELGGTSLRHLRYHQGGSGQYPT